MQRYTLTEYADASRETRAVYDDFMRTTGATEVPIWLKSLGHSAPLPAPTGSGRGAPCSRATCPCR